MSYRRSIPGGDQIAIRIGWMRIRGNRRRRSVDRGIILSDHSDWGGLVETIAASERPLHKVEQPLTISSGYRIK